MQIPPIQNPETLPQHFLERVRIYGNRKVAVRQKDYGIWQEYSWMDSYNNVRAFTLGLIGLGLQRGDRVTIVGDNDRQYLWADIGIMSAGGVTVGIFTDATPPEIEYVINHSGAVFAMAKDQEQCDKLFEIREKVPSIKKVIYWDPRGMYNYKDPWLISFEEVQKHEADPSSTQDQLFLENVLSGKGLDLANLCYTSGTTGLPKGVMLTHRNFTAACQSFMEVEPHSDMDNLVSFAPLAWIAEHTLSVTPHVMHGVIVNFPEAPETVQENIREIAPDIIFYSARLWENLTALIQIRIMETTPINRFLYHAFLPVGYKIADCFYANQKPGLGWRILYWFGEKLVFEPLRDQLGLIRVRSAITAGGALSPDMFRFFRALGINLKQVFSSTETTAVGTMHRNNDVKFSTVGKVVDNMKLKVTEDGEICLSGDNIFTGYYRDEAATSKSLEIDNEGNHWFHTADAGFIDSSGHLVYLDRMKDMIELATGEKYPPQFIQGQLKFSPYIRDVMSIGGGDKEYVSALISIDFDNVGRWAEKRGIVYTTYLDLSQKTEVYTLILGDVVKVNNTLPEGARVQKIVLMHKEFDADEAEMTRTRKLRRAYLMDQYHDLIDAIYGDADAFQVIAQVKYQDGRSSTIETQVRIMKTEIKEVTNS